MLSPVYYALLVTLILLAWYFACSAHAGYRAGKILRLIELALAGEGRVIDFEWLGRSQFLLKLRLDSRFFTRASCIVEMKPRHDLLKWILFIAARRAETVTFQADLGHSQGFDLSILSQRWWAESRKKLSRSRASWDFFAPAPFVIASTDECNEQISTALSTMIEHHCEDVNSVKFSSESPNFIATLPLESLPAQAQQRPSFFDTFRALAYQASAPRR